MLKLCIAINWQYTGHMRLNLFESINQSNQFDSIDCKQQSDFNSINQKKN